jgi:hypothetical protein
MDDLSQDFYSSPFFAINRRKDEELPLSSSSPESTLITVHRCQVCNKEQEQQQKGNTTICLQCQADEEVARVTQNTTTSVSQKCLFAMPFKLQNLFVLLAHVNKKTITSYSYRIQCS